MNTIKLSMNMPNGTIFTLTCETVEEAVLLYRKQRKEHLIKNRPIAGWYNMGNERFSI